MKIRIKKGIGLFISAILFLQSGVYTQATEQLSPEQQREADINASYNKTIESNTIKDWPQGPQVYGDSAIVMDMKTGAILYEKGIDEQRYPASITKILTALVAIENSKPTDMVKFSEESIQSLQPGYAHIAMKAGEEISMKDALHALMLASANEVAYAIGETVGGTHENFIKMMNDKAKKLGCTHTHFINTNGMFDEQHYTSARDMALIARAAFSHQELLDIVQTLQYTIQPTNMESQPRIFQQKHKMLLNGKYHDDRCIGGKTGYTEKAYNTLVTVMEQGDMEIVAVIMRSRKDTFQDTKKICDYAFNNFKEVNISENETSKKIKNIEKDACVTLPKNMDFDMLTKTYKKNKVNYCYAGKVVGETKAKIVDGKKETKKEVKKETGNPFLMKIIMAVIIILIIGFVILFILKNTSRKKKRRKR
ncbi:D-alanyl-D-alanine carboxypeptidase family protein [Faecalimonas sp.]